MIINKSEERTTNLDMIVSELNKLRSSLLISSPSTVFVIDWALENPMDRFTGIFSLVTELMISNKDFESMFNMAVLTGKAKKLVG